jgi:hypothetical protein
MSLALQYCCFVFAARRHALATFGAPYPFDRKPNGASAKKLHEERQRGAMLADAGLPSKATETSLDKATSWLAMLAASDSSRSLLEGGGGGRRLALAGRRPVARCTSWSVGETGCSGADAGLARWSNPSGIPSDEVWPALDGADTSMLLLRSGGQLGRCGRHS